MIDSLVSFGFGTFFGGFITLVAIALRNAASSRDDWKEEV
jgi:hypothetical protein